jgi:UDP-N-acetylglucosamine 2-epimerase
MLVDIDSSKIVSEVSSTLYDKTYYEKINKVQNLYEEDNLLKN